MEALEGKRFGRLTVLGRAQNLRSRHRKLLCKCDCGNETVVFAFSLLQRSTQSCGCLGKEQRWKAIIGNQFRLRHGEGRNSRQSPEYRSWALMIWRCENPRADSFSYYGERGIKVCERWRKDYLAFLSDMGRKPSRRHSIDRKDNDGNYEPNNCRWATPTEQRHNRREAVSRM